jgi:small-conductance mechanosensitive channel
MVIEEFTFSLMKVFAIKRYVVMRTIVSYFGFVLALMYGFASGTNASSITVLSFVLGVAFGPVIQTIVKMIRKTSIGPRLEFKQD